MYDPSLMIAPNVGGMIQQGFAQGQQERQQNMARGAMAVLVRDPTNERALAALAQVDPERAMEFRKQQLEYHKSQLAEHNDSIKAAASIIQRVKAANPQMPDDQVYAIAHRSAIQAGIPGAELAPPTYNKEYFDGLLYLADPAHDQGKDIPIQQGGSVMHINPDGTGRMVVVPNPGNQPTGAPVSGPLTDEQIRQIMNGGQAATPPATFP